MRVSQAHERTRPQRVKGHLQAMERLALIPVERVKTQGVARPMEAFGQAEGQTHELKR